MSDKHHLFEKDYLFEKDHLFEIVQRLILKLAYSF